MLPIETNSSTGGGVRLLIRRFDGMERINSIIAEEYPPSRRDSQDAVLEIHPQDLNSQILNQNEGSTELTPSREAPSGGNINRNLAIAIGVPSIVYSGLMFSNLDSPLVREHYVKFIVAHFIYSASLFSYYTARSRNNQRQELSSGPIITADLVHVHPALPAGTNNSTEGLMPITVESLFSPSNALPAGTNNSTEILMPITVESLFSPPQKEVSRD